MTMNKNKCKIPALVILVLAVLTALGVKTFFGPCVHEDGSFGPCHWAGQAIFGTALLMAAQSLAAVLRKDDGIQGGLYAGMVMTAVLGILIPGTLISLCKMASMRCNAVMRPAVTLLFAAMAAAAVTGLVLWKKKG